MSIMPPIPDWDAIHPAIVHLPIGIITATPVLLLLAILIPRMRMGLAYTTAILLILATITAFLATNSGEVASDLPSFPSDPKAQEILHEHDDFAHFTRNYAATFAGLFAIAVIIMAVMKKRMKPVVFVIVLVIALLAALILCRQLAWTGHTGARLVHEMGVMAPISKSVGLVEDDDAGGDDREHDH